MLLLPVHGATAGCLDGCVRDGAAPIRVRFVTHGRQSDSFWQAMRDNVINSAAVFGAAFDPAADWVWYESDAAQAATIRSHSDTSVALIVSAQSNQVAAAVRDAAAAGVRVLGINSGLTLLRAAGADLSAYIGMDERLRGAKAAERMIAAGVSNPVSWKRRTTIGRAPSLSALPWLQVVVDHGLAPTASEGDLWSEDRWNGFRSTFEGQGITPVRIGIKSEPAAWELSSDMKVLAGMQAALLSSALAQCEHDGVLAMGSTSLQQVAHLAMERGCWSGGGMNYTNSGVSGRSTVLTFDDDELARTMLTAGALDAIVSGVHDAKYVVRTPPQRPPRAPASHDRAHSEAALSGLCRHVASLPPVTGGVRAHRAALPRLDPHVLSPTARNQYGH